MHSQTDLDDSYKNALKWTDPSQYKIPDVGSDAERLMLEQLEDLFTNYTYENLQHSFPRVYANNFYFRDAFKQFNRLDELMPYMLKGVEAVSGVNFVFNHIIRSRNEFFIEWTMSIKFKGKDDFESSIGMSRFRFDSSGKVIFHQDYWDPTALIYQKIPIAKQLINFVQNRV
ncbi:hypothetical protein OA542_01160 [Opitutae bacterium]|nr:hypothetical protein [Opitutae bacterium]